MYNLQDLAVVYSKSRYSTCIPADLGGSGNPSPYTAKGVVTSMEGALDHLNMGDIKGKTIAMMVWLSTLIPIFLYPMFRMVMYIFVIRALCLL